MSFERGKPHFVRHVFLGVNLRALLAVAQQVEHGATEVAGHLVDQFVALGMHRAGVERMAASRIRRKPAACS